MRTRTTLIAAAAVLLATLTACGGSHTKADPQACKKALYDQYRDTERQNRVQDVVGSD